MKHRAQRIGLLAVMTLSAINIWTGAPLLAVWVGSQFARGSGLSMGAVFIVIVVLAVTCFVLATALSWLSAQYDELTGRPAAARRTSPWLRSMRGERERYPDEVPRLTALERILVIMVVVAFVAFEIWFFFFSTSPIDQRSGRGEVPTKVAMRG